MTIYPTVANISGDSPNRINPNNAVNIIDAYVKMEISFAGAKL